MAGRGRGNGRNLEDAFVTMTGLMESMQHQAGPPEFQGLDKFRRNDPPKFSGGFNPEGAQKWLKDIEKIFKVMMCTEAQKVSFGTHMLVDEAEQWWENVTPRVESANTEVTWKVFREAFLEKYFPVDVRNKKVMEFLELKQENLSIAEYSTSFENLVKYHPYYNELGGEKLKCVKFVSGLRPDIRQAVNCQRIEQFQILVDTCRIYEEDNQLKVAHFKKLNTERNQKSNTQNQNRYKPYARNSFGKRSGNQNNAQTSVGNGNRSIASGPLKCFQCGKMGHMAKNCGDQRSECSNCGRFGHATKDCWSSKKGQQIIPREPQSNQPRASGRVFTLSGSDVSKSDNLVQGDCLLNNYPLIALFDSGATHSFVSHEIVVRLSMHVSVLSVNLTVSTPTNESVVATGICLSCPLCVKGRRF